MSDGHQHDRFLYEKDGNLHYGCLNPFCGHGNPALPNHWTVPMETDAVKLRVVEHKGGRRLEEGELTLEITWKEDFGSQRKGEIMKVTMPDNLEDNKAEFDRIFHKDKKASNSCEAAALE